MHWTKYTSLCSLPPLQNVSQDTKAPPRPPAPTRTGENAFSLGEGKLEGRCPYLDTLVLSFIFVEYFCDVN